MSRHDLHGIDETYTRRIFDAQAMMSEWGDILGAAGSYECAHICGNVPYELGRVRHSFERIGLKVSDVEMGGQLCGNQPVS